MKIGKSRSELELEIQSMIKLFSYEVDDNEIDLIVEHLNAKHGINMSEVYSMFNNTNNLSKFTDEELGLFGEQVAHRLGVETNSWKREWFTDLEIKEYSRYQHIDISKFDEVEFPIELKDVWDMGNGYYAYKMSVSEIARFRKYGKLNYNENVQRGTRKVYKYGTEFTEPIVFKNKVEAIKRDILNNDIVPSKIALNAAQMSAVDGVELEYNAKKSTLIIHEGTVLDIVDGMHRVLGSYSAWMENKDVQGYYIAIITNKTDEEVKKHQLDIDKSTKLLRGRILEMKAPSKMSEVINILKTTDELKDRITSTSDSKKSLKGGELFPYRILLGVLDRQFKVNTTLEARKLAEHIKEYNVYLFGYFEQYLNSEYKLLFDADVYEGHMVLMKKMLEKNIPFDQLEIIININDFHKDSKVLGDLLDGKGNFEKIKEVRIRIIEFFNTLVS